MPSKLKYACTQLHMWVCRSTPKPLINICKFVLLFDIAKEDPSCRLAIILHLSTILQLDLADCAIFSVFDCWHLLARFSYPISICLIYLMRYWKRKTKEEGRNSCYGMLTCTAGFPISRIAFIAGACIRPICISASCTSMAWRRCILTLIDICKISNK